MYSLNLAPDGRVLSAAFARFAPGGVIVDALPEGNLYDYIYANGQFVRSPLPADEQTEIPSVDERLDALEAALLEIIIGGGA